MKPVSDTFLQAIKDNPDTGEGLRLTIDGQDLPAAMLTQVLVGLGWTPPGAPTQAIQVHIRPQDVTRHIRQAERSAPHHRL